MSNVNLPDFREYVPFNDLRSKMGAPLVEYVADGPAPRRISFRDVERLRTTGIEVSPDEIEVLPNGTFAYQGVPVLLYIYSPTQWQNAQLRLPRYHISNCRTWRDMKSKGRSDRYVASTRVDGSFELEVYMSGGSSRRITERLDVCQNCLDELSWDGFRNDLVRAERRTHVQNFSLDSFFQHYGRSMVREKPKWSPLTIPSGAYSDDFDEVSARLRARAGWRCQDPRCGRLLSSLWERRFLHVHHKNGVKGDNSPENLMILCLGCHARQPGHDHMRHSKDYLEFKRLFGDGVDARTETRTNVIAKPAAPETAPTQKRLVERLREASLKPIDHRSAGGALWVVGGDELTPLFAGLRAEGIRFVFARNGSRATNHKPGWYTSHNA